MQVALGQEWFTLDEVADLLRVSKRTIERLVSAGEMESKRFGPRLRRVSREALDAYVNEATR